MKAHTPEQAVAIRNMMAGRLLQRYRPEHREFPKFGEEMTTRMYIREYYRLNMLGDPYKVFECLK